MKNRSVKVSLEYTRIVQLYHVNIKCSSRFYDFVYLFNDTSKRILILNFMFYYKKVISFIKTNHFSLFYNKKIKLFENNFK